MELSVRDSKCTSVRCRMTLQLCLVDRSEKLFNSLSLDCSLRIGLLVRCWWSAVRAELSFIQVLVGADAHELEWPT